MAAKRTSSRPTRTRSIPTPSSSSSSSSSSSPVCASPDPAAELASLRQTLAILETTNAHLIRENEHLRELTNRAMAAERTAMETMVNISYQRTYGIAPFPAAPKLEHAPAPAEDAEDRSSRVGPAVVQGRDIVRQHLNQFLREAQSRAEKGEISQDLARRLPQLVKAL